MCRRARSSNTWGVLQVADLGIQGGSLSIRLPRSTTDQMGKGAQILLHRCEGDRVCPVANVEAYLAIRPSRGASALLLHEDATPRSRFQFTRVLCKAVAVQQACRRETLPPIPLE